ncbi:hypothetical protein GCM10022381_39270 [Leifsonia kafniensis]|uniref:Uncharacterized protein n=1 Tax=Leifsonia kafniensis TaxID=475957 RepID=A0ABP7L2C7_9MICO
MLAERIERELVGVADPHRQKMIVICGEFDSAEGTCHARKRVVLREGGL